MLMSGTSPASRAAGPSTSASLGDLAVPCVRRGVHVVDVVPHLVEGILSERVAALQ
jgi:hypothetical protein